MNDEDITELKRILTQFKLDCINYTYNLALLRGWKYAKKLNVFKNKKHFEFYIYHLYKLGIKYKQDFFLYK